MEAKDAPIWEIVRRGDASEGLLFDELSRSLASGAISRRRALKLAGAAIVGSTGLLSLFPGAAGAQSVVYGTTVSAAAIGQGGCAEGAPAISNGACPENSCGGNRNCFCAVTVNGTKRCVDLRNAICPERDEGDSNEDCPRGEVCIKPGGCCGHRRRNDCRPLCNV